MRGKILLTILFFIPLLINAQINVTTQLPADGMLLQDQLWSVAITNSGNDIVTLKIQLDVKDILQGQSVINATSGKIVVGKGFKVITLRDVQPVMYNYVATEYGGKYLPCGSYIISYRVVQETNKGDEPVATEVVKMNVVPLAPPQLTTPADKSSIETVYPQFTWLPPAPLEMFNPLQYDINVVAVEEGQSPKEAIEFNKPVYFNTNIQYPAEKMPSSFEQLHQGKTYAWQVVARSGAAYATPTEIWMFTIGKDSIKEIIDQAPYIKISRANTEVTIAQQGMLKMEYNNTCNDKKITVLIYKPQDKEKRNSQNIQFDLDLRNGQNFLMYDISKKAKLDEKIVYEVALINSRGEEWLMKFKPVYYKK